MYMLTLARAPRPKAKQIYDGGGVISLKAPARNHNPARRLPTTMVGHSSLSSSSSSESSTVDLSGDLSNADMKTMLVQIMKKMPKTPEPTEEEDSPVRVTRSASGNKSKKPKL